jgi:hypothetical protein
VSSGRARESLTAPELQKTSSEPTGRLEQGLDETAINKPNRFDGPSQVQEPVREDEPSQVTEPVRNDVPIEVQKPSQVGEKGASPFMIYAISGDYTARAKQALLWTLSGQCERAVASYRVLIVDDTENTTLYEALLVEAERRCSLREVQP